MTVELKTVAMDANDHVQKSTVQNEDPSRERVQTCWKNTKDFFSFVCNPPPYPPLTRREVNDKYLTAGPPLLLGSCFGTLATTLFILTYTDSVPDAPDIASSRIALGIASTVCLGLAAFGTHVLRRTCKSPRAAEEQPLLSNRVPASGTSPEYAG